MPNCHYPSFWTGGDVSWKTKYNWFNLCVSAETEVHANVLHHTYMKKNLINEFLLFCVFFRLFLSLLVCVCVCCVWCLVLILPLVVCWDPLGNTFPVPCTPEIEKTPKLSARQRRRLARQSEHCLVRGTSMMKLQTCDLWTQLLSVDVFQDVAAPSQHGCTVDRLQQEAEPRGDEMVCRGNRAGMTDGVQLVITVHTAQFLHFHTYQLTTEDEAWHNCSESSSSSSSGQVHLSDDEGSHTPHFPLHKLHHQSPIETIAADVWMRPEHGTDLRGGRLRNWSSSQMTF